MQPQHLIQLGARIRQHRRFLRYALVAAASLLLLLTPTLRLHAQEPYLLLWWTDGAPMSSQGPGYALVSALNPMAGPTLQGGPYTLGKPVGVLTSPTFHSNLGRQPALTTTTTSQPSDSTQTRKLYLPFVVAATR